MVADGSVGSGCRVYRFSFYLIRECNLSGLLWDCQCCICVLTVRKSDLGIVLAISRV